MGPGLRSTCAKAQASRDDREPEEVLRDRSRQTIVLKHDHQPTPRCRLSRTANRRTKPPCDTIPKASGGPTVIAGEAATTGEAIVQKHDMRCPRDLMEFNATDRSGDFMMPGS